MQSTKHHPSEPEIVARLVKSRVLPAADEIFRPWAETMPAAEPPDDITTKRNQSRAATEVGAIGLMIRAIREVFGR